MRPFQMVVRNQSEAELSDCREQGAASRCWVLNNSGVCGIIIEYLFEKDD